MVSVDSRAQSADACSSPEEESCRTWGWRRQLVETSRGKYELAQSPSGPTLRRQSGTGNIKDASPQTGWPAELASAQRGVDELALLLGRLKSQPGRPEAEEEAATCRTSAAAGHPLQRFAESMGSISGLRLPTPPPPQVPSEAAADVPVDEVEPGPRQGRPTQGGSTKPRAPRVSELYQRVASLEVELRLARESNNRVGRGGFGLSHHDLLAAYFRGLAGDPPGSLQLSGAASFDTATQQAESPASDDSRPCLVDCLRSFGTPTKALRLLRSTAPTMTPEKLWRSCRKLQRSSVVQEPASPQHNRRLPGRPFANPTGPARLPSSDSCPALRSTQQTHDSPRAERLCWGTPASLRPAPERPQDPGLPRALEPPAATVPAPAPEAAAVQHACEEAVRRSREAARAASVTAIALSASQPQLGPFSSTLACSPYTSSTALHPPSDQLEISPFGFNHDRLQPRVLWPATPSVGIATAPDVAAASPIARPRMTVDDASSASCWPGRQDAPARTLPISPEMAETPSGVRQPLLPPSQQELELRHRSLAQIRERREQQQVKLREQAMILQKLRLDCQYLKPDSGPAVL